MQLVTLPIYCKVTLVVNVDICTTVARNPVNGITRSAQSSNLDNLTIGCLPKLLSYVMSVKFDPIGFDGPSKVLLVVKH